MKKALLVLIASFALCGSILAQHTTHWPEFSPDPYENWDMITAYIKIDGSYVTDAGNWADLEVAAFVGTECRGTSFLNDEYIAWGLGWLYPFIELGVNYNGNGGESVTFVMYDHVTGMTYSDGIPSVTITTGTDHDELYNMDFDNALIISFTTPSATTISVEKAILGYTSGAKDHYYLISTPVENANPATVTGDPVGMTEADFDLYWFNENSASTEWQNYEAGNFNLEFLKGYLYASSVSTTLTFTGAPYSGDGKVTLNMAGTTAGIAGLNLIGNPYNDDAFLVDASNHAVSYYRMNDEGTGFSSEMTNEIAKCEGVFVQASSDGENVWFTTTPPSKGGRLDINVAQQATGRGMRTADNAIVRFDGGSTLEKYSFREGGTKVYIPVDNRDYAVASAGGVGEMPVSFKAEANGTYTLGFTAQDVEFGYLHLIDNLTGSDVDLLADPSYTFDARTTDYASRFRLVFATSAEADGETFGFYNDGQIILGGVSAGTTVQIVDMLGRVIVSENGAHTVSTTGMAPGVYVLCLVNGGDVKTQKIVVR